MPAPVSRDAVPLLGFAQYFRASRDAVALLGFALNFRASRDAVVLLGFALILKTVAAVTTSDTEREIKCACPYGAVKWFYQNGLY